MFGYGVPILTLSFYMCAVSWANVSSFNSEL